MKKALLGIFLPLIYILLNAFCVFSAPLTAQTASAESSATQIPTQGTYACILEESFFYSIPNENSGLFLLPKTYYVRLLEYGSEYCKIEYGTDNVYSKRLVGYTKTNQLTFVDYVPKCPYLYYLFDVTYRIDDSVNANSSFLDQITMTCAYYGDYKIGSKTYCYVLREERFGYVTKPISVYYEENTEYAEYLENLQASASAPSENDSLGSAKTNISPLHVAILVALCLLIPLLAALILKPPRRPPYETDS